MRDLERLLKGVEGGFKKVRLYNLDTFIPAKVEWEALTGGLVGGERVC
jgi:hypothetical protein